jgi:quercetin dioxygenase-like cupin family protein
MEGPVSTPFRTTVLVRSEDTGGAYALVENVAAGGWPGPPLHHPHFAEAFYVLDGELVLQLEDDHVRAGPDTFVHVPGGARHTLGNRSDREARYLLYCIPGGFERYFDRMAAEQAGTDPPASAALPYPETIVVGPQIPGDARPARAAAQADAGSLLDTRLTGGALSLRLCDLAGHDSWERPAGEPDLCLYLVGGEAALHAGAEARTIGPHEHAILPHDVPRAVANPGETPARKLLAETPSAPSASPRHDRQGG